MSGAGERRAHLWGTGLHPSHADGKGGCWTGWERDGAAWHGLAAPVGAGEPALSACQAVTAP